MLELYEVKLSVKFCRKKRNNSKTIFRTTLVCSSSGAAVSATLRLVHILYDNFSISRVKSLVFTMMTTEQNTNNITFIIFGKTGKTYIPTGVFAIDFHGNKKKT